MTPSTRRIDRRPTLCGRLRAFARDDGGATILEFALISAPLFALLIAIIETSLVFFAQQGMETTAEAAGRLIMTGQAQSSGWSQSQYKTQVCKSLLPYMSCSKLLVDVQTATSFGTASTSTPTLTNPDGTTATMQYSLGTAGSIVVVRLVYLWPIATGPLGFDLGGGTGHRVLLSTSVAKTEPYT